MCMKRKINYIYKYIIDFITFSVLYYNIKDSMKIENKFILLKYIQIFIQSYKFFGSLFLEPIHFLQIQLFYDLED